ncbi:hypothetical protein [Streptomyces xiamenensis]|uniref:hypothetical protein n=1 Tax=Streptomyces xiamenensis TaxID=408015 RepID=UPI003D72A943
MHSESTPSDIYRLRQSVRTAHNASRGDWAYYEDLDALRGAILTAMLDIAAHEIHPQEPTSRLARLWRAHLGLTDYPRTKEIVTVERHTDAGWIPVPHRLVLPGVLIGDEIPERAA